MITTNNAIYLHLPKTAGQWVTEVLRPIAIAYFSHGIIVDEKPNHAFVFVRDPWDWHVSLYHFLKNGSNKFEGPKLTTQKLFLPTASFDDFINNFCNPSPEFKHSLFVYFSAKAILGDMPDELPVKNALSSYAVLKEWDKNNLGYYENLAKFYLNGATYVGKYENLQQELLNMVTMSGDLTDEINKRIHLTNPINISNGRGDYKSYYNDHTAELVYNSTRFLDPYGYKF